MKTKDFGLASLMLSKEKKLLNHTRDEYGRYWFDFENDKQLENDFYSNDAVVHVQDFLNAQRRLKSLIFKSNEYGYGKNNQTVR
jgi:hypothetical protein